MLQQKKLLALEKEMKPQKKQQLQNEKQQKEEQPQNEKQQKEEQLQNEKQQKEDDKLFFLTFFDQVLQVLK